MRRVACAFIVGLAVAAVAAPLPARAQATEAYDQLVREGLGEFERGNWLEAYNLFRQAHEGSPNARTLRGMGMASFELKEYPRALEQLRAALDSRETPLTPELRQHVQQLIDRCRRFVAQLTLRVQPPEASVFIDREQTDKREILVRVGKVVVRAELRGHAPLERVVKADGGEAYSVDLDFDAQAGGTALDEPAPQQPVDLGLTAQAPDDPGSNSDSVMASPWLWTGMGAAVLTGILVAVLASSGGDSLEGARAPMSNVGIEASALGGALP